MASPITDPPIPYLGPIEGGFEDGKMVRIQGFAPPDGQRFNINFQTGPQTSPRDDVALHLSVRLLEGYVARNTLQNGSWGAEQGQGVLPIGLGERFEIIVLVGLSDFKVAINGNHFCEFPQRIPASRVTHLAIEGTVVVSLISFEGNEISSKSVGSQEGGMQGQQYGPPAGQYGPPGQYAPPPTGQYPQYGPPQGGYGPPPQGGYGPPGPPPGHQPNSSNIGLVPPKPGIYEPSAPTMDERQTNPSVPPAAPYPRPPAPYPPANNPVFPTPNSTYPPGNSYPPPYSQNSPFPQNPPYRPPSNPPFPPPYPQNSPYPPNPAPPSHPQNSPYPQNRPPNPALPPSYPQNSPFPQNPALPYPQGNYPRYPPGPNPAYPRPPPFGNPNMPRYGPPTTPLYPGLPPQQGNLYASPQQKDKSSIKDKAVKYGLPIVGTGLAVYALSKVMGSSSSSDSD